jgi:hypothetical protein
MTDHQIPQAETRASNDADEVIRNAEARRIQTPSKEEARSVKAGRPLADDPAPFSEALGIPTLLNASGSSRSTSARTVEETNRGDGPATKTSSSEGDSDFFVSSEVGLPLLSDNPTPLSSALKIPTLINESKPADRR